MKFSNKILTLFLTGMLLTAGHLFAQEPDVSSWIQKAEQAGIEQSVLSELQTRVENGGIGGEELESIMTHALAMSEENLPAEMAIQKALEGFSKGIPGGRIISVVDKLHGSASQASKIVDPWMKKSQVRQMTARFEGSMSRDKFRTELTKATSKSFMQNLPADAVTEVLSQIGSESILSSAGPSDVVAAMGILPDLPQAANNAESSGKFIVRALKEGFKADDLQKLPAAIKIAQERSQLPAASVVKGVSGQMQKNIPAKQILQNLFNGNVGGGPPGNIPKGLENKPDRGQKGSDNRPTG
jgi:hypothetical protein